MSAQQEPLPSLVSTSSMAVIVLFILLATGAVGLRLHARSKVVSELRSRLGADDYMIIVALVFSWSLFVTAIVIAAGAGINFIQGDPLEASVLILKIFFVEPLLEFPGQACTRISVLLFYRKIFVTKKFQLICNIFIAVVAIWGLSAAITDLTGIRPIWKAWDPTGEWDIDFGAYSIAIGAIGIAIDVITLTLPLPVIHRLHMKLQNKIFTAGILWLGVFCVIADAVRLSYTVQEINLALSEDGAQRFLVGRSVWLWDRIAPCASILAACLPTYGPLLRGRSLQAIVRSAASWLSFSSTRGSPGTSGVNAKNRQPDGDSETDSQRQLRSWERLHDDHGSTTAHIAREDIPLEELEQAHHQKPPGGVTVTSTVNLEYSRQNGA